MEPMGIYKFKVTIKGKSCGPDTRRGMFGIERLGFKVQNLGFRVLGLRELGLRAVF